MESALAPLTAGDKVVLERLQTPTFDALRTRLLGEPVHVLHFVGHGLFDPDGRQGLLLFEDGRGQGHAVPASSLAMLLHNHSSLRLVYLNACEGAIADEGNVFCRRGPDAGTGRRTRGRGHAGRDHRQGGH